VRLSQLNVGSQRTVLRHLAELTMKSIVHPTVRHAAMQITGSVDARDDMGELQAIFDAVKSGDSRVEGLENGFRYVADPRATDYFTAPYRSLEACTRGACAGDCDDHAALVAALAGALGFKVGLRAWGRMGQDFEHVYAVAAVSKRAPKKVIAMDTTVPEFSLGDEPPPGRVLTAWLE
jgi:hypothetical protein